MKRVCKGSAPGALQDYISKYPKATWEQMSGDNAQGGSQAVQACRGQTIHDQRGLCAYCETRISTDNPLHCRIEHYHPKSDKTGIHNWSLDWDNMLAVCDGGSFSSQEEQKTYPLPGNLSCDAHKDYMVQTGKLPTSCEEFLLDPRTIPAFPNLFAFDKGTE